MSSPSSPSRAVVALVHTSSESEWQPILHSANNQVVLYNPRSHALTISNSVHQYRSSVIATRHSKECPYCKQSLPPSFEPDMESEGGDVEDVLDPLDHTDPAYQTRSSNYFQLLEISNETISRPSSPPVVLAPELEHPDSPSSAFPAEQMAEGYFKRFFQEEYKLGMGANGSVFLCQHMLDGNPLGHFAVKKIAVGESHSYLLKILREVRLLERLHHPNIVTYHHAWLENSQFSSFGPRIPTLHVLMQWAEGGSLDDFIDIRLGRRPAHPHIHPVPNHTSFSRFDSNEEFLKGDMDQASGPSTPSVDSENLQSRSARIRAFRAFQRATPQERERMLHEGYGREETKGKNKDDWAPVHLLSADEVKGLFQDVVEGLGFLHAKSILHLDLKPGNVLLTWDDGRMIPRAMLSDFGTSRDMVNSGRIPRSGNTGTLEYTSPESLPSPETGLLHQIDSKSDMWSLGMILHKMLFFKLPYRYAAEGDANGESSSLGSHAEGEKLARLEQEVLQYPGFKSNIALATNFEARRLPIAFLVLLERLLDRSPAGRPSCDRVVMAVREGKLDPLKESPKHRNGSNSPDALVPVTRSQTRTEGVIVDGVEAARSRSSTPSNDEKARLRGLPPASEILGPADDDHSNSRINAAWMQVGKVMRSKKGRIGLRLVRSCLLACKVLTLPRLCPSFGSQPRPALLAALLGTAIADTVIEFEPWHRGILVSLGLAALHWCTIRYGSRTVQCCV
ncbi:other/IKS protein kinase [Coprinopsis marcescibilis]|uniref:non-specific serine/threonine protein kinase n=1 Tax=Coprinopsis marcescibilis TaxID=230819 RepID=A0A5C3L7F0_COPMA|nr:other/IKS protein kinase [Coprinopsis marcescibilis]